MPFIKPAIIKQQAVSLPGSKPMDDNKKQKQYSKPKCITISLFNSKCKVRIQKGFKKISHIFIRHSILINIHF